jgi:nucleoside-diphosphate-sugar epimerase
MTILVTGAAGFLGQSVAVRLAKNGHAVAKTDASGSTADIIQCDVRDGSAVDSLLERLKPARIVHCGAISGPALARDNPRLVFEVNTAGTWNLLDAARRCRVQKFVLLSSICAYGPLRSRRDVNEDEPLMATDPYGASKVCAERCLTSFASAFEFGAVALRMSSIYGPGRQTDCVIQALVRSANGGDPAIIYNDGKAPRQLVHINDATEAVVLATLADRSNQLAYNVCGGTFQPEIEVAEEVRSLLPATRFLVISDPSDFPDSDMGPMNLGAAKRDFAYRPHISFQSGLAEYVAQLAQRR